MQDHEENFNPIIPTGIADHGVEDTYRMPFNTRPSVDTVNNTYQMPFDTGPFIDDSFLTSNNPGYVADIFSDASIPVHGSTTVDFDSHLGGQF